MRSLPDPLRDWAEPLAALAPDLALMLVPWVRRLDAAFGELGRDRVTASGEPDGYDGLATRGPYQRLLASQWLLADVEPDEFLRRAAMSEHSFYRLAHRAPQTDEAIVVLMDAGPDQLGAPRLGHLATLVALARRAQRRGARLIWGALQAREPTLQEGLDRPAVSAWLELRTDRRPTGQDLEHWLGWLQKVLRASKESWLVGSRQLAELPSARELGHVAFESPLFDERASLQLSVRKPGSRQLARAVALPMPDQQDAVRVLRDPFKQAQQRPLSLDRRRIDVTGGVRLSPDGRNVSVRLVGGGVVSYPVPNSERATPGRPRYFEPGASHHVVAVARRGRRVFAVTVQGDQVCFFGVGGEQLASGHRMLRRRSGALSELVSPADQAAPDLLRADFVVGFGDVRTDPLGSELLGELVLFVTPRGLGLAVCRSSGELVVLEPTGGDGYAVRNATRACCAIAPWEAPEHVLLVRRAAMEVTVQTLTGRVFASITMDHLYAGEVFLGERTLAVEVAAREYRLQSGGAKLVLQLRAPPDVRPVGVLRDGLLCLESGDTRLRFLGRSVSQLLAHCRSRIAHVSAAFDRPLVACLSEEGELKVVRRGGELPLLHVDPLVGR